MTQSIYERFAAAKADLAEKHALEQRLTDTRAELATLHSRANNSDDVVVMEESDVQRLSGVVGFFRRILAGRGEFAVEQQELAAAQLARAALQEELTATLVYIASLTERVRALNPAPARFTAVLADLENLERNHAGPATEQLNELAIADGVIRAALREVTEAQAAGELAYRAICAVHLAVANAREARTTDKVDSLWSQATSSFQHDFEMASYEVMSQQIATAQHATSVFRRECLDVESLASNEVSDFAELSPLPSLGVMIVRNVIWSNRETADDVSSEISGLSSFVETCLRELATRAGELEAEQRRLMEQRVALLTPTE